MIENPCEWGDATLLIFSQNVGSLIYYTHILPLLVSLFLGVYVLINAPQHLANRVLFFAMTMFAIWCYFDLILWASYTSTYVMFFWSAIVPIEMLFYLSSLYFVYLFSTDHKDAPLKLKVAVGLLMLPIVLFMHTPLNVMGLSPDCDIGAHEGPLITYMYLVEILIIFLVGFFVWRGYRSLETPSKRQQLLLIGLATASSLTIFTLGNLTLLFELGPFYEKYKLFGMPLFAAIIVYTIIKYDNAFRIKALTTEILVSALFILILSISLFEDMETVRMTIFGTLFVFTLLGAQLARSVRKEVEQREHIEDLVKNLSQANKRLKQLDTLKNEFVSVASHQLRSPLTAIRGYSSMLLEGSFGTVPDHLKEPLHRISESSAFMALSVEDYLSVSRIESGNMRYDLVDFNLLREVEKIVDDLRRTAVKQGLLLTFKNDLQKQGIVHADLGKTQQIIHNLLTNALKYTKRGTVSIHVHQNTEGNKVYLDVTDTGIGMSADTVDALFGKFIRAKNAHTVNVNGTGLGLYIAREMARHMKGDITGTSPGEGQGSTFRLTLPLHL